MIKKIKDLNINYEFNNIKSDITLIFLHGWGQNIEMMLPLSNQYNKYFNTLIVDLPGFGKSDEPKEIWGVVEYTDLIHELVKSLKLNKIILIGHSFGGRISLLYSSLYKVEKLICLASPYCPEIKKLSLKTRIYKKIKKIPILKLFAPLMQRLIGSKDYNNASKIMRGVLVKTVNYNLEEDVKKIKAPTLLVWGDLDEAVNVSRAYELNKLINNSGVVIYNGATHYAYLERINELVIVLDNFLGVNR